MIRRKVGDLRFRCSRNEGLRVSKGRGPFRGLCGYIAVRGGGSIEGDDRMQLIVDLSDHQNTRRRLLLPKSSLLNTTSMSVPLMDADFDVPQRLADRRALLAYLASRRPNRTFSIVSRTGFVADAAYVHPDGHVEGQTDEKPVIYRPASAPRRAVPLRAGTLEGWIAGVAEPARHSALMMFAIGVSLGSILMKALQVESGGFHLYSRRSSKGKTLVEIVAATVHGCGDRDTLPTWDSTASGIEELAAEHCDRLLVLDDLGHISGDARNAASIVHKTSFKLTAGFGRVRSSSFANGDPAPRWRVLLLSSGELSLTELAAAAGRQRLRGDLVRLIDIPAVTSGTRGIFDDLPPNTTPADLAHAIEQAGRAHYGHAARRMIALVLDDSRSVIADGQRRMERFMRDAAVPEDGWERRFAQRFALAYAAIGLAHTLGLLSWTRAEAFAAVGAIYRRAREVVPQPATERRLRTRLPK